MLALVLLKVLMPSDIVFNELKVHMQEDIVAKLIDFLVAPHPTTTVLLAEKEKVCLPNCSFFIDFSF